MLPLSPPFYLQFQHCDWLNKFIVFWVKTKFKFCDKMIVMSFFPQSHESLGSAVEEFQAATAWFAVVVQVCLDVVNTLKVSELMTQGRLSCPLATLLPLPPTPVAWDSISYQNQNAQSQHADCWQMRSSCEIIFRPGFFVTRSDFFSKVPLPTFLPRPKTEGEG